MAKLAYATLILLLVILPIFFNIQVEQVGCDSMLVKIALLEFSCSIFFSLQGLNGKIEVCYFRLFFLAI